MKLVIFPFGLIAFSASQALAQGHLLTEEHIQNDTAALIAAELEDSYQVTSLQVEPREKQRLYGDQTVYINFQTVKISTAPRLGTKQALEKDWCNKVGYFYLLCQPIGHKFSGRLVLKYVYTNKGMAYRVPLQLKQYPLAQYLEVKDSEKAGYVLPQNPNLSIERMSPGKHGAASHFTR